MNDNKQKNTIFEAKKILIKERVLLKKKETLTKALKTIESKLFDVEDGLKSIQGQYLYEPNDKAKEKKHTLEELSNFLKNKNKVFFVEGNERKKYFKSLFNH